MIIYNKEQIIRRAEDSKATNRILLDGGLVGSLEFVRYRPYQERDQLVGRIVEILDKRDVPKKELQLFPKAKKMGTQKDKFVLLQLFEKPPAGTRRPNPREYSNIPDSLNEVIDTCKLEWIPAQYVDTVAFVFHQEQIQKGSLPVHGMMDVFFVRNQINCHYKNSENGLVPNKTCCH
ncbi:MAG: hypothetical protein AAF587_45110, partial [Bacteroidota bacterium]